MPFVRTAVRQGTDASQKQLIVESIHCALVQAIGMPEDELFNLVSEYNASDFLYSRTFNGVARSDHLVVVEITMRRGRSDAMKKASSLRRDRSQPGEARRYLVEGRVHLHARERLFGLVRGQWAVRHGPRAAGRQHRLRSGRKLRDRGLLADVAGHDDERQIQAACFDHA